MANPRTYKFVRVLKLDTLTYDLKPEDNYALCIPLPEGDKDWYSILIWSKDLFERLNHFQTHEDYARYGKYEGSNYIRFHHRNSNQESKEIFLDHMHNRSGVKHIGAAFHEAVFRMSLLLGTEGRVVLDANYNSHAFHFLNGFRSTNPETNLEIEKLLKEAKAQKQQVQSQYLFAIDMIMTPETIAEKIKKLHLPSPQKHRLYSNMFICQKLIV